MSSDERKIIMGIVFHNGLIDVITQTYEIKGSVIAADIGGRRTFSTDWKLLNQERLKETDSYGVLDGLSISFETPDGLHIVWHGGLYEGTDIFSCRMAIENMLSYDVHVKSLLPLFVRGISGANLSVSGIDPLGCVMLNNGKWMADAKTLLSSLDPRALTDSYHVSAFMDAASDRGLVFGMGERTNTIVHMKASVNRTGFDLIISGDLDTDLKGSPLLIKSGSGFSMNRVVLLSGDTIPGMFTRYGDYLARYMRIDTSKIRSASGIFCVYGQDREDSDDWEKIALSDARMKELITISDRHLRPYGLEYLKTQFGGASSGPSYSDGTNIYWRREWTEDKIKPLPPPGMSLAELIEEEGFTPDTCKLKAYHPFGVRWMCDLIRVHGYKNALVCRPYLNVVSGSEEREELCAEIFEMAVKKWGYDYLMFDFNDQDFETDNHEITIAQAMTARFQTVRDRVGPDIYIEACMIMPGCIIGLADSYRPTMDWRGGTEEELIGKLSCMYFLHRRVFSLDSEFFDPDFTPFVWGSQQSTYDHTRYIGSLERIRSWTSWCALSGFNLFTGGVIDSVSDERWRIFTRALPINGECATPLDFASSQQPSVWKLKINICSVDRVVFGLFNWDTLRQKHVQLDFGKLGLNPQEKYLALSFWEEKVYELYDGISFELLPIGCLILLVSPLNGETQYLGSNRHVCNTTGLSELAFVQEGNEICGCSEGPPREEITHYIYLPGKRGPVSSEGCEFEISQPGVLRVRTVTDPSGICRWKIRLGNSMITV